MKILIIFTLLATIALSAYAIPLTPFPGIDGLIEKAKHICVITIVKHISGDGQGYDEYHVWVRRTLKGDVPGDKTAAIALLYNPSSSTNGTLDSRFVDYHTYVVFLEDAQTPYSKAPYRNLQIRNSSWEVSLPHPDWLPDPSIPLRDTIKLLANRHLQFKEQVVAGDRAIFKKVFEEPYVEEIMELPKQP